MSLLHLEHLSDRAAPVMLLTPAFGPGVSPDMQAVVRQVFDHAGAALTAPAGQPDALVIQVNGAPLAGPDLGNAYQGGPITLSSAARFHADPDTGPALDESDLYSVVSHELGHALGLGTSPAWFDRVQGGAFVGGAAESVYGGPVPLDAGSGYAHWADGLALGSRQALMDPYIAAGVRSGWSTLDAAALRDIGYQALPTLVDPVAAPTTPFPGYGGAVQWARGDVTGDGVTDWLATPAHGSHVKAFDGATGAEVRSYLAYPGYDGAVALATIDVNADGCADIITSAATNGHIKIVDGRSGDLLLSALPPA